MEQCFIISFRTVHHILKAERLLKEEKFPFEIIPTPTSVSAACGVSLKVRDTEIPLRLCAGFLDYAPQVYSCDSL